MCSPPPLYLLPLVLVYGFFDSVGSKLSSLDEKIRESNAKIVELAQRVKTFKERKTIRISHEEEDELIKLLIARCMLRIEQLMFKDAKEDIVKAMELIDSNSDSNGFTSILYLCEYLHGLCDYGNNEFDSAILHFENSIDFRLQLEKHYEKDGEQAIFELENQILKLSDGKVKSKIVSPFKLVRQQMSEAKVKTKNYVNQELKLQSNKAILKTKPKTLISLELIYIRAALSYYNSNYFQQAVEKFTKAIEIGNSYQSDLLGNTHFQRGLVNYFMENFDEAILDFTISKNMTNVLRREQIYLNRALCYQAKGMSKEMIKDEKKAHLLNSYLKKPKVHLRKINEDCLIHLFEYLKTTDLMVLYGTSRFVRSILQKYCKNFVIRLDFDEHEYKEQEVGMASKLFLPKREIFKIDIYNHLLSHPLIENHAKRLYVNAKLTLQLLKKISNVQHLTLNQFPCEFEGFIRRNSTLEHLYLRINWEWKDSSQLEKLISSIPHLKTVMIGFALFKTNPFTNSSLKKIVYCVNTQSFVDNFAKKVPDISQYTSCKDLEKEMPNITFERIIVK